MKLKLFITTLLLSAAGFLKAAESATPKTIAALFFSERCGSCKVLDPKVQEAKSALATSDVLFVTFDHSNEASRAQAAMMAGALGIGEAYAAQQKASGFMVLVDAQSGKVLNKLTKAQSAAEIRDAITVTL